MTRSSLLLFVLLAACSSTGSAPSPIDGLDAGQGGASSASAGSGGAGGSQASTSSSSSGAGGGGGAVPVDAGPVCCPPLDDGGAGWCCYPGGPTFHDCGSLVTVSCTLGG